MGVICKSQEEAAILHTSLGEGTKVRLLDKNSSQFSSGVVISSAHMAKGLEFDEVIVPNCDQSNYDTEIDRQMLYVACSRAMHKLTLLYIGNFTSLLKGD